MKHIDAEKLIANLERQNVDRKVIKPVIRIITPLQQEHPKVDLVAELKHHLATTPKEQLEKEWKELEPWCNIGPTVQEFLYGKQPEIDLEKEYKNWWNSISDKINVEHIMEWYMHETARRFYELGLNARKED